MELDELKYQLNQKMSADNAGQINTDLTSLLKKKTHTVIGKIKRSLVWELVCCIIFSTVMLLICLITDHWSIRVYFGVFAGIMFLLNFVLYYLYKKTNELSRADKPVKSNLVDYIKLLEDFVKRYFQFTMLMVPICFTFSAILSNLENMELPQSDQSILHYFTRKWQVLVFFAVYIIVFTVSAYYLSKWYLKKLYGNYLTQLKEYVLELDN